MSSPYIPIRSLAGSVFSYSCRDRGILVLKAYLDDSGTHDHSDVIVMGGLIASEDEWAKLEPQWQALIDEYGIPKGLHMSKCANRDRKAGYAGWSDFKRRKAASRFRRLIIGTKGRLIASAVSRNDWNAACEKSDLGILFQSPIDFLQATALRKALESKRSSTKGHEQVSVVFDCREQSLIAWDGISKGYEQRWNERFVGYSFGRTEKVLPLQAADMIAYEALVFQCDRIKLGEEPKPRASFRRLIEGLSSDLAYFTEAHLLDYMTKLDGLRGK